ncbi:MAG: 50S ribosomal protein L24 [Parcubacteria group bacterium 21-54-25]|nr:MAG: 50S ribosomal protein L24 [Parcubacteria group bacterium 21-54-25]HQU08258.1 50S ribosomal protein L24 [Candidatus Paceibacterota bacterium]
MKLKKGDMVKVITGKDKGKTGAVLRVLPHENRVVVEGVAMAKRHRRGAPGQTGRIVEHPLSINASNVMAIDPETKKPTRLRIVRTDGVRTRVAVKSGKALA